MKIDWEDNRGQRFFINNINMGMINWCRNTLESDTFCIERFSSFMYIHLFETEDIIVFKLKFMSMYEEFKFNGASVINGN